MRHDTCHLFIFIDAMGAEVLRGHPVFQDVAPYQAALRSVLGYSSACVPSILSGRLPQEHLHWSYFTHGAGSLRTPWWLHVLPTAIRDRGRIRRWLSGAIARHNAITGYFQLYQMPVEHLHRYGHCEPTNIFLPGGLNRGDTIFDTLHERRVPYWVSDWHQPAAANWQTMASSLQSTDTPFYFMYDAELDGWLHRNTRQSPELPARLTAIAERVRHVTDLAKQRFDDVRVTVFSDHGMCTIEDHLDVFPLLARSGLRMHQDYHAVIDSTMVRLWFDKASVGESLLRSLEDEPRLRRLSDLELREEGCAFPDRRFGDVILIADPGVLLVPSHMGAKPIAGMHGFSPRHPDSDAAIVSSHAIDGVNGITDIHTRMIEAVDAIDPDHAHVHAA